MRKQLLLQKIREYMIDVLRRKPRSLIAALGFVMLVAVSCYFLSSFSVNVQGNEVEKAEVQPEVKDKLWYEQTNTICHAGGVTKEGDIGTNSLEALTYNYEQGHRVFEIDMQITSDGVMVLRHDWSSDFGQADNFGWTEENKTIPTVEQFLNASIYDKYTPMTLLDLYKFMERREDIYVVLDPKYTEDIEEQFDLIVNTAINNGYDSVLDRVIVQIDYEHMYERVESVYSFENYLYTLYYNGYFDMGEEEGFCAEEGIPVLVMPWGWVNDTICERAKEYKVKLFVHTVNDVEDAERLLDMGVDGIYTDTLLPEQIKKLTKSE